VKKRGKAKAEIEGELMKEMKKVEEKRPFCATCTYK
jgi:hypothetical protein